MLELINLKIISDIFAKHKKVSSKAKILYINCLMGHFKDLKATTENSMEFTLFIIKIKNYNIWQRYFIELHEAKIIKIYTVANSIIFTNLWGQLIDRTKLDLSKTINVESTFKLASDLKEQILENKSLYDLCGMKYKMTSSQVSMKIELFCKEQDAANKKYKDFGEASQHFNYWIAKGVNSPTQNLVSSSSKILGLD
jgi:hypothetical protein